VNGFNVTGFDPSPWGSAAPQMLGLGQSLMVRSAFDTIQDENAP
jgi:hypothetical protein